MSLKTAEGDTALHKAGRWNQKEIVILLLGSGADPKVTDLVSNPYIASSRSLQCKGQMFVRLRTESCECVHFAGNNPISETT